MNSFWERFCASVDRWPERPAIVVQGRETLTVFDYTSLRAEALLFARELANAGVVAGDRCAIFGENGPAWVAAYLGILRLSAVAVPVDRTYTAAQVEILARDSGARVLLYSAAYAEVGHAVRESVGDSLKLLELHALHGVPNAEAIEQQLPPYAPIVDAPALVLYTSGTTADPKGVVLTHRNLLAAVNGMTSVIPLDETDSSLGALPLFHILAQVATLLLPFAVGAHVVQLEEVNAGEVLRAMRERRISVLCTVPQFFYLIHERIEQEIARQSAVRRGIFRLLVGLSGVARNRLGMNIGRVVFRRVHELCGPNVRFFVSAGAAFDPEVARALYHLGFDIIQAYGLTETTGAATVTPPQEIRIGAVGRPLPGVSVEVRNGDGKPCAVGEEGEIAILGPTLTPGYYERWDATTAAFRNGWFLSGDLGFFGEDGQLRITGRSKDVIVLGSGKNIYPEEIERHLEKSKFIKEVCVFGRQQHGRAQSEVLHAVIVPEMNAAREYRIVNIRDYIRNEVETLSAQLPGHKRIMGFDLSTEDLPRTTTRKIKRFVVQKSFTGTDHLKSDPTPRERSWTEEDRTWTENPVAAATLQLIASQAPVRPASIHPDDSLEMDLGIDSLARVELIVAIEHGFGITLSESAKLDSYTVRDLVGAVVAAAPATMGGGITPTGGVAWPAVLTARSNEVAPLPRGTNPLLDGMRFVFLSLINIAARLLVRLDIRGLENLPRGEAFIICVNHQSYLDGFLVFGALPYGIARRTLLLGKTRIFRRTGAAWFADHFNIAVVDADANLVQAMRVSARALDEGRPLLLFPEGERSINGELKPLRRGASILACHLRLPIVPIVLDGTFAIWPRGRGFQGLAPVGIRVLPPVVPTESCTEFDQCVADITATLQTRMEAALEDLRGARPT